MNNVLIVFPDPQLSYSPSTLNLYDALSKEFDVEILSFEPDHNFSSHRITDRKVKYLDIPKQEPGVPLIRRIYLEFHKTFFKSRSHYNLLLSKKAEALIKAIKAFDGEIIAIDFFALWCVQQAGKKGHLFSLELLDYDRYRDACNLQAIESVIIQSNDRYEFLFGSRKLKTFLVQNAPVYINADIKVSERKKTNLIFCGSAVPTFGIFNCIEFVADYPEYTLTVKGAIPPAVKKVISESFDVLLKEKRLILDDEYVSTQNLIEFLKPFHIGFVFYDVFRFDYINKFNYRTAPSGKLFLYYNAGIPVIANRLTGLKSVEDFAAGVLIDSMGSKTIKQAIDKIDLDYESYVMGAKSASIRFDFKSNIQPFVDYLVKHSSGPRIGLN